MGESTRLTEAIEALWPDAAACPTFAIKTEPHIWARISGSREPEDSLIDLSDLLPHTGARSRHAAMKTAMERIEAACLPEHALVVFDTSEGWLTTNVSYSLRRTRPAITQVGLQHGLFSVDGIKNRPVVRQARRLVTSLVHRCTGSTPIGVGFGNLSLDGFVVFGKRFEDHIRRLFPASQVRTDFHRLVGSGAWNEAANPADILFLDQDLGYYIDHAASIKQQIRSRLENLARSGQFVIARAHPKSTGNEWATREPESLVIDRSPGPFHDSISSNTVVVSFFSTGLLEAASRGCPIIALRVDGVPDHLYSAFDATMTINDFVSSGSLPTSTIKDGLIDG